MMQKQPIEYQVVCSVQREKYVRMMSTSAAMATSLQRISNELKWETIKITAPMNEGVNQMCLRILPSTAELCNEPTNPINKNKLEEVRQKVIRLRLLGRRAY
jgi:hypothetical protein